MISDLTRETIVKVQRPREAAPPAAQQPVEFRVKTAMFYRCERAEAGALLKVDMLEAIDLLGNHHAELVHPADAARICAASRAVVIDEGKTARPRDAFVASFRY